MTIEFAVVVIVTVAVVVDVVAAAVAEVQVLRPLHNCSFSGFAARATARNATLWAVTQNFRLQKLFFLSGLFPFKSFSSRGSIFLDSTGRLCFPSLRSSLVNIALIATHGGG